MNNAPLLGSAAKLAKMLTKGEARRIHHHRQKTRQ
jgi:hypothetical protein